jgi:hypothetical protein
MDINQIQAKVEEILKSQLSVGDDWTEEDWAEFEAECGEGDE